MNALNLPAALALLAALACSPASAATSSFPGAIPASDPALDALRGGFEIPYNGSTLFLAFSLDQMTYINGQLVSSMKLTPVALLQGAGAALPPSGPSPSSLSGGSSALVNLVQNGSSNSFSVPPDLSSLTTVIQNTVNDQVIRNLTILNASLSIRSAASAMQLGNALNQAIAASLR